MIKHYSLSILIFCLITSCFSCSKDENYEPQPMDVTQESPVIFDIEAVPYASLLEYQFFQGDIKDLTPSYGVLPYSLITGLFSDYAKKKRLIWMPKNVKATYIDDYSPFNFPVGTVLIKNFFYTNVQPENTSKIIETRLMYKKASGWEFAEYVWNEEQTDAILTTEASTIDIEWIANGETKQVNYKIPSASECFTCHNAFDSPIPIGPKPQNLNKDVLYDDGYMNQLAKWVEQGFLEEGYPDNIDTTVRWNDSSQPLEIRARSYIDINCAHCHTEGNYCDYRPMRFSFKENRDLENMGLCVTPETDIGNGLTKIIAPNNTTESVVYFRMNTTIEQYRMPLLGRKLIHTEGVELMQNWINSITDTCN